jgi:hypothetical protein
MKAVTLVYLCFALLLTNVTLAIPTTSYAPWGNDPMLTANSALKDWMVGSEVFQLSGDVGPAFQGAAIGTQPQMLYPSSCAVLNSQIPSSSAGLFSSAAYSADVSKENRMGRKDNDAASVPEQGSTISLAGAALFGLVVFRAACRIFGEAKTF